MNDDEGSTRRRRAPAVAQEHRTVSRVTAILELVARNPAGLTLAELAMELEAPRSSVHYLVKGLVATGYLTDGGTYLLGPAVDILLGSRSSSIEQVAHPYLTELHREFDETNLLCMRIGDQIVYADVIESTRPVRFSAPLNFRRPIYPSSAGRCFLAHADQQFRESYLTAHVPERSARRILDAELDDIVRRGVGFADQHMTPDLGGVNAPVFRDGTHVAVITVAGPAARIDPRVEDIADAVARAASELSNDLASTAV